MALNPESGRSQEIPQPHTNLRSEATVESLLKEGRYPTILISFEDQHYDQAQVFIPSGKSARPESFTVSLEEAREIVAIRAKFERQH